MEELSQSILFTGMVVAAVFLSFLPLWLFRMKNKHKVDKVSEISVRKDYTRSFLYACHKVYNYLPVIRKAYQETIQHILNNYPADSYTINKLSAVMMNRAVFGFLLTFLASFLMSGGDWYFILAGGLVAYVMGTILLKGGLEKMEDTILEQFLSVLSDVRHHYHDCRIVDEALYRTLEESPYEIGLHLTQVYQTTIHTDIKTAGEEYAQKAPNKFLVTFSGICASITEYGDKKLEDGRSLFLANLNYLKEEIQMEILRRKDRKNRFAGLIFVSLFPVIFVKPIELWAKEVLEGMDSIYDGTYGLVAMSAIFLMTYLSYTLVEIIKSDRKTELKEDSLWLWLSALPVLGKILNAEINIHYARAVKTDGQLKLTGDRTGPRAFLMKRIVFGTACFGIVIFVMAAAMQAGRKNLITGFGEAFTNVAVPDEKTLEQMRVVAEEYMSEGLKHPEISQEALIEKIREQSGLKNVYAKLIASEITLRQQKLTGIYFKWYYLLLALMAAVIAFMVPRWILIYQVSLCRQQMEDEVSQFQTLVLILMHTDGVTLSLILEWMERYAYCFKSAITDCILNLEYGEQDALLRLKEEEHQFLPFIRFVDNLLSIDTVGVEDAFDEIVTERAYFQEKRKLDNETDIKKRASSATAVAYLPLYVLIGGYLVIPMLLSCYSMFTSISAALSA